jgi:16S rRNA (guanine527-N7)-methyltransferase
MNRHSGSDEGRDSLLEAGLRQIAEADTDAAGLINSRRQAIPGLLERYIAEIELFNPAYGLVKVRNRRELILKHILDSLAPLGIIARLLKDTPAEALDSNPAPAGGVPGRPSPLPCPRIADVGSGAGLPGIPLAIVMPGAEFTLIERMGRRAGFLRNVKAVLGLSNVQVEEAEMEKIAPGQFDLVVFRAFRPLESGILKNLLRLCTSGGGLAAYKGKRDKIEKEMAPPGSPDYRIFPCPVPFLEEERHIVRVRRG